MTVTPWGQRVLPVGVRVAGSVPRKWAFGQLDDPARLVVRQVFCPAADVGVEAGQGVHADARGLLLQIDVAGPVAVPESEDAFGFQDSGTVLGDGEAAVVAGHHLHPGGAGAPGVLEHFQHRRSPRRARSSTFPPWRRRRTVAAPGAFCTAEGGRLETGIATRIAGPPALLSVADATVEEARGAVLEFAVTLNRGSTRAVTVDYATSDGTTTAGADYVHTEGTLGTNSQRASPKYEPRWLQRALTINTVIAWRLMVMTQLGRDVPASHPQLLFTDIELRFLNDYAAEIGLPPPNHLAAAVLLLAILGGYQNRTHDPPPGHQIMWRGYERISIATIGYRIAQRKRAGIVQNE